MIKSQITPTSAPTTLLTRWTLEAAQPLPTQTYLDVMSELVPLLEARLPELAEGDKVLQILLPRNNLMAVVFLWNPRQVTVRLNPSDSYQKL